MKAAEVFACGLSGLSRFTETLFKETRVAAGFFKFEPLMKETKLNSAHFKWAAISCPGKYISKWQPIKLTV